MRFSQNREGRGAVVLVNLRQFHRVPVHGKLTLAGRSPLDFGDDGRAVGGIQGGFEADGRRPPGDVGLKPLGHPDLEQPEGIFQFPGDDFSKSSLESLSSRLAWERSPKLLLGKQTEL
jgi:hypothetical protein